MSNNDQIRSLISHDGLRDSLTGLMSLPSFLESTERELSSALRFQRNLNIFLISLVEVDANGNSQLVVRGEREASQLTEDELYNLSARVLEVSKRLISDLRTNDLIARYALADFLILNSGDHNEITKKLTYIADACGAVAVGLEVVPKEAVQSRALTKNLHEEVRKAIASLERKLLAKLET